MEGIKHSMGRREATLSTLLAPLLLDADISKAFFPGQNKEKENTDGAEERAEMTIFIEYSQYLQCMKCCVRGLALVISLSSPKNTTKWHCNSHFTDVDIEVKSNLLMTAQMIRAELVSNIGLSDPLMLCIIP